MNIIHKRARAKLNMKPTMEGIQIQYQLSIRVQGLTFDLDGGAASWLRKPTTQWKDGMKLLKCTSNK